MKSKDDQSLFLSQRVSKSIPRKLLERARISVGFLISITVLVTICAILIVLTLPIYPVGIVIVSLIGVSFGLLNLLPLVGNRALPDSSYSRFVRIGFGLLSFVMVVLFPGSILGELGVLIGVSLLGYHLIRLCDAKANVLGLPLILEACLCLIVGFATYGLALIPLALSYNFEPTASSGLIYVFIILSIIADLRARGSLDPQRTFHDEVWPLSVASFAVGIALYLRAHSPFPQMPGWDIYPHMYDIQYIINFHGIYALFIPYPLGFHIGIAGLAASSSAVFPLFWYAIFLTIPIFSILVYLICTTIGATSLQASTASIVSTVVCGLGQSLGPNYLVPSTIGLDLMIVAILLAFKGEFGLKKMIPMILVLVSALAVYYYLVVVMFPMLYYGLYQNLKPRFRFLPTPTVVLGVLFFFLALGAFYLSTNQGPSAVNRLAFLEMAYSSVGAFFLVANTSLLLLFKKPDTDIDWKTIRFVALFCGVLLIVFSIPNSASIRLELPIRVFAGFLIVFPFWVFGMANIRTKVQVMSIAILFVLILQPFSFPYNTDINNNSVDGVYTQILPSEVQAIQWLRSNIPIQSAVLTDPASAALIEGVGFRYASDINRANTSLLMNFFQLSTVEHVSTLTFSPTNASQFLTNQGQIQTPSEWLIKSVPTKLTQNLMYTGEYYLYGSRQFSQSFKVDSTEISEITLKARIVGALASNDGLTIQLLEGPDKTETNSVIVASQTIPVSSIGNNFGPIEIPLKGAPLIRGLNYFIHLNLSVPDGNTTNYVGIVADSNPVYGYGLTYFRSSSTGAWSSLGGDLYFQVFSAPADLENTKLTLGSSVLQISGTIGANDSINIAYDGQVSVSSGTQYSVIGSSLQLSPGKNVIEITAGNQTTVMATVKWVETFGSGLGESQILSLLTAMTANAPRSVVKSYDFVLVSGRTSSWVIQGIPGAIEYSPSENISQFDGISKFTNSTGFQLVYSNASVEIFQILH